MRGADRLAQSLTHETVPCVATIAAISMTIEMTRFITAGLAAGGHIADINDWLCNTAGGATGFGLFTLRSAFPRPRDVLTASAGTSNPTHRPCEPQLGEIAHPSTS